MWALYTHHTLPGKQTHNTDTQPPAVHSCCLGPENALLCPALLLLCFATGVLCPLGNQTSMCNSRCSGSWKLLCCQNALTAPSTQPSCLCSNCCEAVHEPFSLVQDVTWVPYAKCGVCNASTFCKRLGGQQSICTLYSPATVLIKGRGPQHSIKTVNQHKGSDHLFSRQRCYKCGLCTTGHEQPSEFYHHITIIQIDLNPAVRRGDASSLGVSLAALTWWHKGRIWHHGAASMANLVHQCIHEMLLVILASTFPFTCHIRARPTLLQRVYAPADAFCTTNELLQVIW